MATSYVRVTDAKNSLVEYQQRRGRLLCCMSSVPKLDHGAPLQHALRESKEQSMVTWKSNRSKPESQLNENSVCLL